MIMSKEEKQKFVRVILDRWIELEYGPEAALLYSWNDLVNWAFKNEWMRTGRRADHRNEMRACWSQMVAAFHEQRCVLMKVNDLPFRRHRVPGTRISTIIKKLDAATIESWLPGPHRPATGLIIIGSEAGENKLLAQQLERDNRSITTRVKNHAKKITDSRVLEHVGTPVPRLEFDD